MPPAPRGMRHDHDLHLDEHLRGQHPLLPETMISPHVLIGAGLALFVTVTLLRWNAPTCSGVPWRQIQIGAYVVATALVAAGVVLIGLDLYLHPLEPGGCWCFSTANIDLKICPKWTTD